MICIKICQMILIVIIQKMNMIMLVLFALPIMNAFKISINNSSEIQVSKQSKVNYIDFMYPYQIFQIMKADKLSPQYIFVKINSSLATDNITHDLLARLPNNILITKQSTAQLQDIIHLTKYNDVDFIIEEYQVLSSDHDKDKKDKVSEAFNKLDKKLQNLDNLIDNLNKGNIDSLLNIYSNTKRIYLFTLNVNYFLMKFLNASTHQEPTQDSLVSNTQLIRLHRQSRLDIASNGSTFRSLVMVDHSQQNMEELIQPQYQFTIFDKGFNVNHHSNLYSLEMPKNLFQDGILTMRVFPVDFGEFYMMIADISLKVWLIKTELHKISLMGIIDLNTHMQNPLPNTVSFIEVFTNTVNYAPLNHIHYYINYIGYLSGRQIKFQLINTHFLKSEETKLTDHQMCQYQISHRSNLLLLSVDKISQKLVSICYFEADYGQAFCEVINIFCELMGEVGKIPPNMKFEWKFIQHPFDKDKDQVQLWLLPSLRKNNKIETQNPSQNNSTENKYPTDQIILFTNFTIPRLSFLQQPSQEQNNQTEESKNIDTINNKNRLLSIDTDQITNNNNTIKNTYNIKDFSLFANFAKQQQQNIHQLMKQQQQLTFMPVSVYSNLFEYKFLKGSRLLQKKLMPYLKQTMDESIETQKNNCELETKKIQDFQIPIRIKFNRNNPNWKICRIAIDVKFQKFVIYPSNKNKVPQKNVYQYFKCGILYSNDSNSSESCFFEQEYLHNRIHLSSKYLNIFFIVNKGQTYDLQIRDMNEQQLHNVTMMFVNLLLAVVLITVVFCIVLILKPMCMYVMIYFRLSTHQPNYMFPLNYFELEIRIKRMKDSGLIIESIPNIEHEHDDCGFCLESKLQAEEKIIQIYCHHSFHATCFKEWIRQESRIQQVACPICKRKITLMGLRRFKEEVKVLSSSYNDSEISLD